MPASGVSSDTLATIEDYIAEILSGRDAALELEIFVRGQYRRGHIDQQTAEHLIQHVDTIVIALQRGQWFGKKIRGNPEII